MEKKNNTNQQLNNRPQKKSKEGVFNYLRFGESYTSLILGIVVVIIATVLFLGIVRARNIKDTPRVSDQSLATQTNPGFQNTLKSSPSVKKDSQGIVTKPPVVSKPPAAYRVTPKIEESKPSTLTSRSKLYIVSKNDNLWNIAVKKYNSGYNWVDIARANNLSNPNILVVGQKLNLPDIEQKNTTIKSRAQEPKENAKVGKNQQEKIIQGQYTAKEGDSLWDIAVRAYGDGYKWVEISRVNKLSNPDLILVNQSLIIPRK